MHTIYSVVLSVTCEEKATVGTLLVLLYLSSGLQGRLWGPGKDDDGSLEEVTQ